MANFDEQLSKGCETLSLVQILEFMRINTKPPKFFKCLNDQT